MGRSARQSAQALATLAREQGGYFTAKQAQTAGYGYRHLDYHETAGNFERVEHGLYRLPTVPPSEHDDLIRLSLWSRNQKDEPQAVASHQTALVLHDLSELLPRELHLTVPPKFRTPAPRGVVLHKATLDDEEIEERAGYRVTSPASHAARRSREWREFGAGCEGDKRRPRTRDGVAQVTQSCAKEVSARRADRGCAPKEETVSAPVTAKERHGNRVQIGGRVDVDVTGIR